jgi:hypothetical protein
MKIKVDAGYKQIQGDGTIGTVNVPYLNMEIEISKEEMEWIKRQDKETYERLFHAIRLGCSEMAKGVQVY